MQIVKDWNKISMSLAFLEYMLINHFVLTKSLKYDTGMTNVDSWKNRYKLSGREIRLG